MKRVWMILILVMSLVSIQGHFFSHELHETNTYTLLYETDDLTELNAYIQTHDIGIQDYDGRIAEIIYTGNDVDTLIDYGFVYEGTYATQGPSWTKPIVNDPYFPNQYALKLTNTDDAWEITTGSSLITVAIIDTGIDIDHPEFTGRISELSYNSVTQTVGLEAIDDDQGHGTMVAGVIGANANNGTGIAGVTNQVQLMVIKANEIGEDTFKDSDIIRAIYYAVDHGADIINLSLGSSYANSLTKKAVEYAYENNVLVVASSGNDGENIKKYPASFDSVISVGSVDQYLSLSSFSNYNDKVDVVAPGSAIITTNFTNTYSTVSGTSFSSPYVAGIAALYKSLHPEATVAHLTEVITSTAKDLGTTGYDIYYGHGLIDALAIVSLSYIQVTIDYPMDIPNSYYYVTSGETITIERPPVIDLYEFVGWYLDEAYQIPYESTYAFTTNTTIYAYYRKTHGIITWVIDDQVVLSETLILGSLPIPPQTNLPGVTFFGWYLDENYTQLVNDFTVNQDQTYYGYYQAQYFELQYMAEDQTTLLSIIQYSSIEPIEWMAGPAKSSDTYFNYTFIGWTEVALYESDIVYVYPIYKKVLKPNLAGLNPGVDTIIEGQSYTDTGIFLLVDGLIVQTLGSIDTSEVGVQTLTYEIYDGDTKVYTLIRKIRVLTDNRLIVTLNKAITTLYVGDDYVDRGVTYNKGILVTTGDVDTSKTGIYKITYTVTYRDQVVVKSRYVIVLAREIETPVGYIPSRKEDDSYES
jgi:hypothetical protein